MNTLPRKMTWILVALVGSTFAFQMLWIPWVQWREHSVYQALRSGVGPEFWWPPGWRRQLRTSLLLEGEARLKDDVEGPLRPQNRPHDEASGRPVAAGIIELVSEDQNQVFRAIVDRGRYSFLPRLLPAGPFKVRLTSPEGRTTGWLQMGPLDSGLHRINWSFSRPSEDGLVRQAQ
jgi:hypothetical protein